MTITMNDEVADPALMEGLLQYCYETGRDRLLSFLATAEGAERANDALISVDVDEYDSFTDLYEEVCTLLDQ